MAESTVEGRVDGARERAEAERAEAQRTDGRGGLAMQWLGLGLAPASFAAHLQIGYALVPWACLRQNSLWVHVSGALSVVLALVGAWIGWRAWHHAGGGDPSEQEGAAPRARFLGVVGFVTSLAISLILAAQWATAFVIAPCQT
jgi:hypothetical protein